jgi:tripartite-type tricarboxylate transporter receptor subunit TctC
MGRALQLAVAGLVLALMLALGGRPASAYPDRPIRVLVSFPAGGSSDLMARTMQPGLEKLLGQPILIENRPGAGGMIAVDMVAKAAPDGYTVGLGGAGALGTNLGLQEKMSYDPQKDVLPVSGLSSSPFILVASSSFPGKSLRDVITLAKASPSSLGIGHGGNGTLMHLTAEMFNQMAGTKIGLVPYRGMAPVMNDVIGGHVALGMVDPPSSMSAIQASQVRAIAISSADRFTQLPDIPTFAEGGVPGFASTGWFGFVVPAGTPPEIIAKLNAAITTVLKDPEVVQRIRSVGAEPMPMSTTEFAAFIKSEIDKWLKVASAASRSN